MARILYVEGDRGRARELLPLLISKGHQVDVAHSAERAMLLLRASMNYQAVVLHLYLPGMDAAELCRWLEALDPDREVYRLVFTWQGQRSPVDLGAGLPRWLPADRFVEGLRRAEELVEALENLLSGKS